MTTITSEKTEAPMTLKILEKEIDRVGTAYGRGRANQRALQAKAAALVKKAAAVQAEAMEAEKAAARAGEELGGFLKELESLSEQRAQRIVEAS